MQKKWRAEKELVLNKLRKNTATFDLFYAILEIVDVIKRGAVKSADTYIMSYHSVSLCITFRVNEKSLETQGFQDFISILVSPPRLELGQNQT